MPKALIEGSAANGVEALRAGLTLCQGGSTCKQRFLLDICLYLGGAAADMLRRNLI